MKRITTLSMLFFATVLFAQEEANKKKFAFNGSVDAFYSANLNAPNDDSYVSPGTSFADSPGFSLGMANLIASYEGKKVGFVADLVFGPRGEAASATVLNQIYAYLNLSESVKLTMGKFNTFLGYEVIAPAVNFNYSTSYLFSNGPFSHTGIKVDFTFSDDISLMLGLMNQTDVTEFNPDGSYAVGAQLGVSGQFLNLLYDKAGLGFEIDYTGGVDLTDSFFLGLNGAYASNDGNGFYGVALYPQLMTSDDFSIGLRGEYFNWLNDGVLVDEPSVFAVTLTGSYTVEDLIIKPELRLDSHSDDVYWNADFEPTSSLASFTLAAIYTF
ncbi:outer membrane beta-barrel protein [Wocania ichthyoenteri]|uniref:outer membrane beta-barrel protein n=1 Tax=Wocania ichthyoenteri TaxID=1230531 RepID=UPI00053ED067|nr:outer membrane beta-barrel protein [Wocania ichthyoenteri]